MYIHLYNTCTCIILYMFMCVDLLCRMLHECCENPLCPHIARDVVMTGLANPTLQSICYFVNEPLVATK